MKRAAAILIVLLIAISMVFSLVPGLVTGA